MSIFDQTVNRELAPCLKEAGFVRHGQTWNRRKDGVVQVISLQRSQNNTELGSKFTLNVGMTPDFGPADRTVHEYNCKHRKRVGYLRPEQRDHWYRYLPKDPASVQAAIAEAHTDIETYVLPYLELPVSTFLPPTLTVTANALARVGFWERINGMARTFKGLWPFR
jgi:hypothetical protein